MLALSPLLLINSLFYYLLLELWNYLATMIYNEYVSRSRCYALSIRWLPPSLLILYFYFSLCIRLVNLCPWLVIRVVSHLTNNLIILGLLK